MTSRSALKVASDFHRFESTIYSSLYLYIYVYIKNMNIKISVYKKKMFKYLHTHPSNSHQMIYIYIYYDIISNKNPENMGQLDGWIIIRLASSFSLRCPWRWLSMLSLSCDLPSCERMEKGLKVYLPSEFWGRVTFKHWKNQCATCTSLEPKKALPRKHEFGDSPRRQRLHRALWKKPSQGRIT